MEEDPYWSSPHTALHHLRGVMGYDARKKQYRRWDDPRLEFDQFEEINLTGAGVTDADVGAWAERLRLPNLKRVSFVNNELTVACIEDLKKIQLQSPQLTHVLLPPHIMEALDQLLVLQERVVTLPDGKKALVLQDPDEEPVLNEDGTFPKPPEPLEQLLEIPVPVHDVELPVLTIEPGEEFMAMNGAKPTDPGVWIGEYRVGDGTTIKCVWPADKAERAKALARARHAGLLEEGVGAQGAR